MRRTIKTVAGLAALTLLVGLGSTAAAEKTYQVGVSEQRTTISFESTTDFEVILGSSSKASGWIKADLAEGRGSVEISVPVSSLKTGIERRDDHMRSKMWLDAGNYPEISFKADAVTRTEDGSWTAKGKFTMHGVSNDLTVKVNVREIPAEAAAKAGLEKGEWLRIATSFSVNLSDYGVKIPGMAAAKVNDTWNVRIQAFASTGK